MGPGVRGVQGSAGAQGIPDEANPEGTEAAGGAALEQLVPLGCLQLQRSHCSLQPLLLTPQPLQLFCRVLNAVVQALQGLGMGVGD